MQKPSRPRLTKPQQDALAFFEANETDPIKNFGKKAPAAKTTNWLIACLYIEKRSVDQFKFHRFCLTELGQRALWLDRPVKPYRYRRA